MDFGEGRFVLNLVLFSYSLGCLTVNGYGGEFVPVIPTNTLMVCQH